MNTKDYLDVSEDDRLAIDSVTETGIVPSALPKKTFFKKITLLIVAIFALIGFGFTAVYVGVNLHLTNTSGIVDRQTEAFWASTQASAATADISPSSPSVADSSNSDPFFNLQNYCAIKKMGTSYPGTSWRILDLALHGHSDLAQKNLDAAVQNAGALWNTNASCGDSPASGVTKKDFEALVHANDDQELFVFAGSPEWDSFKAAVSKDADVIHRVEQETGVKGRVLVAELATEQMRVFFTNRGWFEKVLSPVKVLASMSKLSWGVMGIKDATAQQIEANLKNPNSPYYLGPDFEHMLDFATSDIGQERFKRITDPNDHYYDYLYAALYNKEIMAQWKNAGFDISDRPEILATLYNIGFRGSKPNADPQMGGAELTLDGGTYSFGRAAYAFYYSGEMLDQFPQ